MRFTRALPLLLLLAALSLPALAQEPAAPPAPEVTTAPADPKIDEAAQKVLDQVKKTFKDAQSMSYNTKLSVNFEAPGQKQETTLNHDVALAKPNKIALKMEGGPMGEINLVSTGDKMYLYLPSQKQYRELDPPADFSEMMEDQSLGLVMAFAEDEPMQSLLEGVTEATSAGAETINGVETQHLKFKQPDADWDLWVGADNRPVRLTIRPDMSQIAGEEGKGAKLEMAVDYSDWKLGDVPADRFAFTPPEGAQNVADIPDEGEEAHSLLGQPAPAFTLDLLDGGQVDLAKHKGKDIVILDFWATWCGPCRRAMPIIDRVADKYKDKNVVLYAVNLQEEPDLIKPFLKEQKLELPVALDTQGEVGNKYQASSIPQTVIIDKDGTVQAVHVGIGPNLEQQLTQELDTLVAGKSLLSENEDPHAGHDHP